MQKSYTFGLNAEELHDTTAGDFREITNVAGGIENHNPYGQGYFNDPSQMALTPDNTKVTSIPSPYARMHITDIAFRELMAGVGVMDANAVMAHVNNMSGDYLRAMSHCLDVYEMMFHFKEMDLIDKGITIKRIELVSKRDGRYRELLAGNKNLSSFIDTLDLFRQRYLQDIRNRNVRSYKFDFTQMYIFKYNGHTFAATSPFTGFFAKADCNLSKAELSVSWVANETKHNHKLFTDTPKEWLGIKDRDPKFLEFLYLLLKDELGEIFRHLFNAVKACIPDLRALAEESFEQRYPEFNFGKVVLPKIAGNTQNESYIRPDGLDCSYLKYLLYLRQPVDLAISEDAYKLDIKDRVFPEGSENKVPWIGVNDFLSDALIVLPYDINENYYAATYIDENNNPHRRCLLPLKRQALDYLDISSITDENLIVKKYSDKHYAVTLKLALTTGGKVELRRDYFDIDEEECVFPNGALKDLQNKGRHFAFGIYPFVRSKSYENIYKVLFYNDFKWPLGYHPQKDEKLYSLDFYYFNQNHCAVAYDRKTKIKENQTNIADKDFDVNTHYFHVSDATRVNGEYICIDFAELSLTLVKNPNSGNPTKINATAIIVPKYHPVAFNDGWTNIAIDLGTSNTFIAYEHEFEKAREISTIHDGWNELTLMNCHCERDDAKEINRDDLYLGTSDNCDVEPDDVCLPAQLCEFIPTRIKQGTDDNEIGYSFPIPSILNNLRVNGKNDANFNDRIALVHSAIPFAYYSIGKRPNTEANRYDSMSNGEFKWFFSKDDDGIFNFDTRKRANFNSFLRELLFIVRSHMLCRGFRLEQCKLLWTYPLSFQSELIEYYQNAWSLSYCLYFNPVLLNPERDKIVDEKKLKDWVKYTNESRSPIYECIANPAVAHHLTILMDIGGGSTDVIGYKNSQPMFITSFGFAGNALYLGGSMNHNEVDLQQNYMRWFVEKTCQDVFKKDSSLSGTKKIGVDAPINTLMNYGLTEAATEFKAIFHNEAVQFMLQFHNAAIFYHTAQLCKIKSADEMPVELYLTGNGSKLVSMNKNKNLVNEIFSKVYGTDANITVVSQDFPKAATAKGSLKGCKKTGKDALKFNEESREQQVVMVGDSDTCFDKDVDASSVELEDTSGYSEAVIANVKNFIEVFFNYYNSQTPYFTKEDILESLEFVKGDPKLDFGTSLSDSMFFQYISLLMEQLSIKMLDRMKQH